MGVCPFYFQYSFPYKIQQIPLFPVLHSWLEPCSINARIGSMSLISSSAPSLARSLPIPCSTQKAKMVSDHQWYHYGGIRPQLTNCWKDRAILLRRWTRGALSFLLPDGSFQLHSITWENPSALQAQLTQDYPAHFLLTFGNSTAQAVWAEKN